MEKQKKRSLSVGALEGEQQIKSGNKLKKKR
jgi:hypothetical protein